MAANADHHAATAADHAAAAEDRTPGTILSDRTDCSASPNASVCTTATERVEDGYRARGVGGCEEAARTACDPRLRPN